MLSDFALATLNQATAEMNVPITRSLSSHTASKMKPLQYMSMYMQVLGSAVATLTFRCPAYPTQVLLVLLTVKVQLTLLTE